MHERYESSEPSPRLSELEVRSLANRALLSGEIHDVDFPGEQRGDRPQPHRFVLQLDPAPLQAYIQQRSSGDLETISYVEIEYDEAYHIEPDELPLESDVRVTVISRIESGFDATLTVDKETIYRLPIDPSSDSIVSESYYDERGRIGHTNDLRENLRQMQDEERLLTLEDVALLRAIG